MEPSTTCHCPPPSAPSPEAFPDPLVQVSAAFGAPVGVGDSGGS